jgi:RNAse (barnase) inhibitor barstar
MSSSPNNEIVLDASHWTHKSDFYASYCNITHAPKWFGMNLDAFCDSLRGGICKVTPEKITIRNLTTNVKNHIGHDFWKSIEEICHNEDVHIEVHTD